MDWRTDPPTHGLNPLNPRIKWTGLKNYWYRLFLNIFVRSTFNPRWTELTHVPKSIFKTLTVLVLYNYKPLAVWNVEELWITDLQCKNKTLTQPDRVSKAEKRVTRYLFFFLSFVSFYCKNDSFSASFRVCMRKILVAGEKIGNKICLSLWGQARQKSSLFLGKSYPWTWVVVFFLVRRLLRTV